MGSPRECVSVKCVRLWERPGERKRDFHKQVENMEIVIFLTLLLVLFICSMSSGVLVILLL